ncbi:hypothetical protein Pint_16940 [Pistacia integerrima]|uniref:Uncharacterized protein n=1 Tax=Pistacia integerrima TaxID=434235 RepID=A0ACC0ZEV3_9ROSI|nr:hypothetical protein Pint_16940 [Pistacia integerrima]
MYDSILARSFSKHEQKKLGYVAIFCCFLIVLSFCTVFKPYLGPLPVLNLRLSIDVSGLKMLIVKDTSTSHLRLKDSTDSQPIEDIIPKKIDEPVCNITERSDFCEINNDIRIDGSSATVYFSSTHEANSSWNIRPYARKYDRVAMSRAKEWSVKSVQQRQLPQCTQNHSIPAIVFSSGGYSGNHFHDFSDILIPLYITSRQFNGEVQFLVTDKHSWWINKFQNVLRNLSNYEIIDIDKEKDIHCFPRGIVGLKRHEKELHIDPSTSPYSIKDFREFIRSSYSLKKATAIKLKDGQNKIKPRLLIISRKRTRTFTNTDKIAEIGRKFGFEVVVTEAESNLSRFAETVNSCDVFLGVHGAGLTNMIFLPEKAVFIQVIPFGGFEWLARTDYEEPSKRMNVRYLEYKIKIEESSLIQQYPIDHQVIKDPSSIGKQGWESI